jgi:hypothetical protein
MACPSNYRENERRKGTIEQEEEAEEEQVRPPHSSNSN